MKPVIIIAIAFVLLIPNIAFAQEPSPQQEEEPYEMIEPGKILIPKTITPTESVNPIAEITISDSGESKNQQEESEQEIPDFNPVNGLFIGMVGNFDGDEPISERIAEQQGEQRHP